MASFDEISGNTLTTIGSSLLNATVSTLATLSRGLIVDLISANVNDFNLMNYDFMQFHMMRNAYEKEITLNSLGEGSYIDGNPDATATPAQYPSYTYGNNYMEFVSSVRDVEKDGVLTTRVTTLDGEVRNLYPDMDNYDDSVKFTGSYTDRNSILYKTKKLIREKKLKTIISQYHTEGVNYNGQIGSVYGESHGRNLLTKAAENGGNTKVDEYGYDNPYCRVWTHNNMYDKLSKTIHSNREDMNYWNGFEWNSGDKGHMEDTTSYGDGENYDYAWRGKHNQDRRWQHSALDPKTGLVKITPQYRVGKEGNEDIYGMQANRHTKDCMFSIENLAWKDYDPYSFEQALSWEQRGPLGGRIMWFPPYGIEVNETASARWNSNDFIGRGEPVYTYVNSERTGNLSFIMITDHPSSIDYASWWDDNNMISGLSGAGNSETDYLRYFAGCTNEDNSGHDKYLNKKPTPLTDEYTKDNPPIIEGEEVKKEYTNPAEMPLDEKNPETVEFFVFYPNNYSGVHDSPTVDQTYVDAIAYLLAGRNAEKNGEHNDDREIHPYSNFDKDSGRNIGYEMGRGPITTDDCDTLKQYIQGGVYGQNKYVADKNKKWRYRIDHKLPYSADNRRLDNYICEKLKKEINYKDTSDYKTNFDVNQNTRVHDMAENKWSLYSFAEVAAAMYSEKILDFPNIYNYLISIGVNQDRVNKLIELFSGENWNLTELKCSGIASSHGHPDNNRVLSNNRSATLVNWLHGYEKWKNIQNSATDADNQVKKVDECDKTNVSGESAKLYRCAHCVMKFSSKSTVPQHKEYVGFEWVKSEPRPDGTIWNYYKKNNTVNYYEQKAGSADNYQDSETNDIVVGEENVLDIFENDEFKPKQTLVVKQNPKYRGEYSEFGVYIGTFDYSQNDDPKIREFVDGEVNSFEEGDYLYFKEKFYLVIESFEESVWENIEDRIRDITYLMVPYAEGDIVLYNGRYYTCKVNFIDKYPDGVYFNVRWDNEDWDGNTQKGIYQYEYGWELVNIIEKVAGVLCYTVEEVIKHISGDANYNILNDNSQYGGIWKYGELGDKFWYNQGTPKINPGTNLVTYVDSEFNTEDVKYTNDERNYVSLLFEQHISTLETPDELFKYITLYRLLDGVDSVKNESGTRNSCETAARNEEEMREKTIRKDESVTEGCEDTLWVDRNDGMLIQECNIKTGGVKARFNAKTGEGEWNKLRYDQEYHFFKQYMEDHPLIFQKLQEKIKYFNPAFHSMTPEGFNARCTFLQQCTRQGNTKTMSDFGGKTANNLAFGRPPYCVLRLGDFYNQMIVIDNISFDYNISDGLQWDLNADGNGVQPMLCKVNISFKFIGGGDITGPVQRLQNAQSFNYYANTSFYDNRADRVEYTPTNWKTMGGAGNDDVNIDKSYAYLPKMYEETEPNIVIPK